MGWRRCLFVPVYAAAVLATCALAWSADRTAEAKRIVGLFAKGDFTTAAKSYADVMKNAGADKKVPQGWRGLLTQAGPFQRQLSTRTDSVDNAGQHYDRVFVSCQFQKMKLDVMVVFDNTGKIAGVFFVPSK